jgi:hypothetical protein
MAEIMLIEKDETVFGKAVYSSLLRIPVGDGAQLLNLPRLVQQFLELCDVNYEADFQTGTFNSLYRTWVEKESYNYKVNLTGKEQHTIVDDANFCQLIKVLIYLMGEMFRRFFQTYDPMAHDTSRAVYTIYGDQTKKQRTSDSFIQFLQEYRHVYMEFCKLSIERTEIYAIYRNASAEARTFFTQQKQQRDMRKQNESVRERAAEFYGRRKVAKAAAKAEAATAASREPVRFAPAPAKVWAMKPTAAPEVVPKPVPVAETDEFVAVKPKGRRK